MILSRVKALVWIVRPGPEVLLLERPQRRGGGFHPVTGKSEAGEPVSESARREALEETGLAGRLLDLGYHHSFADPRSGRPCEEHAFLLSVAAGSEPTLSSEHVAARWTRPEDAATSVRWPAHREALDRAIEAFRRA